MIRAIWMPALALGAVLAVNGVASAQTGSPAKSGFSSGTTMTLGGTGTAAQAATAQDTELTHGYHHYYHGGYRGYYGGFGFGVAYSPSVYYSSYYPAYYPTYYPTYYSDYPYSYGVAYPVGYGYAYPRRAGITVGVGVGFRRISGDQSDTNAPIIALSMNNSKSSTGQPSVAAQAGGFRYDGGPANPVPLPRADTNPTAAATPSATGLPVSLPKAKPTNPYTYKAYGEK